MKGRKTVREVLTETASLLFPVSKEDAAFEAKELVCSALGKRRLTALERETVLTPKQENKLAALVKRRLSHEPLQYILGEWEFMGLPFKVIPAALIPRPDTETLCENAEKLIRKKQYKTLLDICTGTGCIGISLAVLCRIKAVLADISSECLLLARENAKLNGISQEISLIKSDLFSNIEGRFDIIAVNPPYIASDIISGLSPEVQKEPRIALDGGADGLDFYRRIKDGFAPHLNKGGALIMEIGFGQRENVCELFKSCGKLSVKQDLGGNDRAVIVET